MMRPQPSRLRMKRRKTVSVTPAMGARTVAGVMGTLPIKRRTGTGARGGASRTASSEPRELSQDLRTNLFYLDWQTKALAFGEGSISVYPRNPWQKLVLCTSFGLAGRSRWSILGVLAAEALDA